MTKPETPKTSQKPSQEELIHSMHGLQAAIEEAQTQLAHHFSKRQIIKRGMLQGVAASVAAALFAGVIVGVFVQFLSTLEGLPFLGDPISEVVDTAPQPAQLGE